MLCLYCPAPYIHRRGDDTVDSQTFHADSGTYNINERVHGTDLVEMDRRDVHVMNLGFGLS